MTTLAEKLTATTLRELHPLIQFHDDKHRENIERTLNENFLKETSGLLQIFEKKTAELSRELQNLFQKNMRLQDVICNQQDTINVLKQKIDELSQKS